MHLLRGPARLAAVVVAVAGLGVVPAGAGPASAHQPRVETTQTDTDGDGLPDEGDGCPTVASGNPTGCPSAGRTVSLRWLKGERRLLAHVTSPVEACASRARIKLWLDRTDRSDKLLSVDASFRGRHRFKVPGGKRYYVTVSPSYAPGVAECGKATSRKVRVPR